MLIIGVVVIVDEVVDKIIIPIYDFVWNISFFRWSFVNFSICVLLGIFAKDYSTRISILSMFVGVEITLFFSLNIRTIFNKYSFYNQCVYMLGSDSLFLHRSYTHGLVKGHGEPKQIQDVLYNIGCIFADRNERNKPIVIWTLERIIDEKIYTRGYIERMMCIDDLEYLEKCLCEAVDDIIKENSFTFSREYMIECRNDLANLLTCNYRYLTKRI